MSELKIDFGAWEEASSKEKVDPCVVHCECGVEVIVAEQWFDDPSVWLAIYSQVGDTSWRTRWHRIWKIIRTGKPYADQICLDAKNAKRLGEYLLMMVDRIEEEEKRSLGE